MFKKNVAGHHDKMALTNTKNSTKHTERHDVTNIQNTLLQNFTKPKFLLCVRISFCNNEQYLKN